MPVDRPSDLRGEGSIALQVMNGLAWASGTAGMVGALAHKGTSLLSHFAATRGLARLVGESRFLAQSANFALFGTAWNCAGAASRLISQGGEDAAQDARIVASSLLCGITILTGTLGRLSPAGRLLHACSTLAGLGLDLFNLHDLYRHHEANPQQVTTAQLVMQAGLTAVFGLDRQTFQAGRQVAQAVGEAFSIRIVAFAGEGPFGGWTMLSTASDGTAAGRTMTLEERVAYDTNVGLQEYFKDETVRINFYTDMENPLLVGAAVMQAGGVPTALALRIAEKHLGARQLDSDYFEERVIDDATEKRLGELAALMQVNAERDLPNADWGKLVEILTIRPRSTPIPVPAASPDLTVTAARAAQATRDAGAEWSSAMEAARMMVRGAQFMVGTIARAETVKIPNPDPVTRAGQPEIPAIHRYLASSETEVQMARDGELQTTRSAAAAYLKEILSKMKYEKVDLYYTTTYNLGKRSIPLVYHDERFKLRTSQGLSRVSIEFLQGTGASVLVVKVDGKLLRVPWSSTTPADAQANVVYAEIERAREVSLRAIAAATDCDLVIVKQATKRPDRFEQGLGLKDLGGDIAFVQFDRNLGKFVGKGCRFTEADGSKPTAVENRDPYPIDFRIAMDGFRRRLEKGKVYIAPTDGHIGVKWVEKVDGREVVMRVQIKNEYPYGCWEVDYSPPLTLSPEHRRLNRTVHTALAQLGATGTMPGHNRVAFQPNADVSVVEPATDGKVEKASFDPLIRVMKAWYENERWIDAATPSAPVRQGYILPPKINNFRETVINGDLDRRSAPPEETRASWFRRVAARIGNATVPKYNRLNVDHAIAGGLNFAATPQQDILRSQEAEGLARAHDNRESARLEWRAPDVVARRNKDDPELFEVDPESADFLNQFFGSFVFLAQRGLDLPKIPG